MATISKVSRKSGDAYKALIRLRGVNPFSKTFKLKEGKAISHTFPEGFSAYWVRAVSDTDCTGSVLFVYR